MKSLVPTLFLVLAILSTGCKLSDQEYATINAWLLCDDCRNGERAAVKAIGGKAVHTLDVFLKGPSRGRIANMEAKFRQTYHTLPSPSVSESDYVAELRRNYVALYQRRAAISLGDIGGTGAVGALRRAQRDAVARAYRPDVVRVINAVLGMRDFPPFSGTIRPSVVRWPNSVHVIRSPSGSAWNRDEAVALYHGAPSDTLIVSRWPAVSDSFSFFAVAAPGQYALLVTGLGPPADTQVASFTIEAAPHSTHSPANAPTVTAATLPQTLQIAMGFRRGDTTDYFRFQPGTALAVTAAVSAAEDAPSLLWYTCPPTALAVLGSPDTLIGHVVDPGGAPIGGAVVRIQGTVVASLTSGTGRFSLPVTPPPPITGGKWVLQVQRIGFPPITRRVQPGADSVVLSLVPSGGGLSHYAMSVRVPAGSCRMLELAVSGVDRARVALLRFLSP